jgi:hypothetical protein
VVHILADSRCRGWHRMVRIVLGLLRDGNFGIGGSGYWRGGIRQHADDYHRTGLGCDYRYKSQRDAIDRRWQWSRLIVVNDIVNHPT